MQLVLSQVDISSNGKFFVELVLNPIPNIQGTWVPVGGTSLAQYAIMNTATEFTGGVIPSSNQANFSKKEYNAVIPRL